MAIGTIVINDDLRTMQIPSTISLLGVESDDDVNILQFQMPKEYNGFDLSEFQARINYMNAGGIGDMYIADDLEVDGEDPTLMNFSWLVGRSACAYVGNVSFIVCLKKFDENSICIQEFNTTVYTLPVLRGLETTEAVVQENADIIEEILKMIEDAGGIDMSNYYTKPEVNALIPSRLPNPNSLTINGTSYDGTEAVNMTLEFDPNVQTAASGQLIHVVDAVQQAIESLVLYDSNDDEIASADIAVANKNLFRIDLLSSSVTNKGITFTKDADGGIIVNGTSTDSNAATSCTLDPHMLVVGNTYTLSSGKTVGFACVVLAINYTDSSSETIIVRNSAKTFTINKAVSSVTGSVQILNIGVSTNNELVFPQLEVGSTASAFVMNSYSSMTYDGSVMPVLPDAISNVWSTDSNVSSMTMEYEADSELTKIDEYINSNLKNINGILVACSDGHGTVSIGVG